MLTKVKRWLFLSLIVFSLIINSYADNSFNKTAFRTRDALESGDYFNLINALGSINKNKASFVDDITITIDMDSEFRGDEETLKHYLAQMINKELGVSKKVSWVGTTYLEGSGKEFIPKNRNDEVLGRKSILREVNGKEVNELTIEQMITSGLLAQRKAIPQVLSANFKLIDKSKGTSQGGNLSLGDKKGDISLYGIQTGNLVIEGNIKIGTLVPIESEQYKLTYKERIHQDYKPYVEYARNANLVLEKDNNKIQEQAKTIDGLLFAYSVMMRDPQEELITKFEVDTLAVMYGDYLPEGLTPKESAVIKFLIAKGIYVPEEFGVLDSSLTQEAFRTYLTRIVNKESRQVLKSISVPYPEELIKEGYVRKTRGVGLEVQSYGIARYDADKKDFKVQENNYYLDLQTINPGANPNVGKVESAAICGEFYYDEKAKEYKYRLEQEQYQDVLFPFKIPEDKIISQDIYFNSKNLVVTQDDYPRIFKLPKGSTGGTYSWNPGDPTEELYGKWSVGVLHRQETFNIEAVPEEDKNEISYIIDKFKNYALTLPKEPKRAPLLSVLINRVVPEVYAEDKKEEPKADIDLTQATDEDKPTVELKLTLWKTVDTVSEYKQYLQVNDIVATVSEEGKDKGKKEIAKSEGKQIFNGTPVEFEINEAFKNSIVKVVYTEVDNPRANQGNKTKVGQFIYTCKNENAARWLLNAMSKADEGRSYFEKGSRKFIPVHKVNTTQDLTMDEKSNERISVTHLGDEQDPRQYIFFYTDKSKNVRTSIVDVKANLATIGRINVIFRTNYIGNIPLVVRNKNVLYVDNKVLPKGSGTNQGNNAQEAWKHTNLGVITKKGDISDNYRLNILVGTEDLVKYIYYYVIKEEPEATNDVLSILRKSSMQINDTDGLGTEHETKLKEYFKEYSFIVVSDELGNNDESELKGIRKAGNNATIGNITTSFSQSNPYLNLAPIINMGRTGKLWKGDIPKTERDNVFNLRGEPELDYEEKPWYFMSLGNYICVDLDITKLQFADAAELYDPSDFDFSIDFSELKERVLKSWEDVNTEYLKKGVEQSTKVLLFIVSFFIPEILASWLVLYGLLTLMKRYKWFIKFCNEYVDLIKVVTFGYSNITVPTSLFRVWSIITIAIILMGLISRGYILMIITMISDLVVQLT